MLLSLLIKTFELKETNDLAIRAFLGNSLTNYLHRLAPELSVEALVVSLVPILMA